MADNDYYYISTADVPADDKDLMVMLNISVSLKSIDETLKTLTKSLGSFLEVYSKILTQQGLV